MPGSICDTRHINMSTDSAYLICVTSVLSALAIDLNAAASVCDLNGVFFLRQKEFIVAYLVSCVCLHNQK